ncbi:MAG: VWA domain-containing protein [SAR324 cluster bacterium]|nr:VWA domain-containing protein [SAR324 cluster bacterium]
MNFLHVNFLLGFLIIPFMLALHIYGQRQRKKFLREFVDERLWSHLLAVPSIFNKRVKLLLLLGGVVMGILALAQPRWGFQWEEVPHHGVDIIIALDVSRSMLAQDINPNRLTRAKREITDLLNLVEGDRVGLVAFAGTSFLQSPLTLDYRAIELFLDGLDTDLISIQGTAIGHALQTSIQAFSDTPRDARAVILITDGEDHSGNLEGIADMASRAGVKLFIMGIGRPEGAPIPDAKGGFTKHEGEMVLSKLNEAALQKLALATGGSYVQSITGDLDLEKIYFQDIRSSLVSKELQSTRRQLWNEQFQWFVLVVILCWMIEPLLSSRVLKKNDNS